MNQNYYGLYALVVLFAVMFFIGGRAIDEHGNVRIGQGDPVTAPKLVSDHQGADLLIRPSRRGSYLTEVTMDGAYVDVLVDTGASYTTLRESDALGAGIHPKTSDFRHVFSTANGEVSAARAIVDELEIGPALLEDVTVYVIPDDKLGVSLLGMNVLKRFDRMEMTDEGLKLSVD